MRVKCPKLDCKHPTKLRMSDCCMRCLGEENFQQHLLNVSALCRLFDLSP